MKADAFAVMATLTLSSVGAVGVLAALGCQHDAIQVGLVSSVVLAILSVGVAMLVREKNEGVGSMAELTTAQKRALLRLRQKAKRDFAKIQRREKRRSGLFALRRGGREYELL